MSVRLIKKDPKSGQKLVKQTGEDHALPEIAVVGRDLTAQYQRIEEAWKKAEQLLALSHVPVDVTVKVKNYSLKDDSGAPVADIFEHLGYCKTKAGFRICWIQETTTAKDDSTEQRLISECPADQRLELMKMFPALQTKVIKVAREHVPKYRDAVDEFERSLQSLPTAD